MDSIIIKGAKENNLQNVDVTIPRNKITCFVGVSGSGKSTVAFDIIAKEGQRQYFESLSSYARRYLSKSNRPNIESISGISPALIISQTRIRPSPRSTVGTITETYTYLRLLYSRVGLPSMDSSYYSFNHPLGACPQCKGLGRAMVIDANKLVDSNKSLNEGAILYSNWRVGSMYWKIIRSTCFFDMDKKVRDYTDDEFNKLMYAPRQRANNDDNGVIMPMFQGIVTHLNNRGLSVSRYVNEDEKRYFNYIDCPTCHGWRLRPESLAVTLNGVNIGEVANMPMYRALEFVRGMTYRNAAVIKPRLVEQLQYLVDTGVGYLSLNRSTDTLSGGEAQRVKMARQLGCDLIESIYVLDEPTAGLHPRDVDVVMKNLRRLRDSNNTVLVVEHDRSVIDGADYIVELGPGGGKQGGKIVFQGDRDALLQSKDSLTLPYLLDDTKGIKSMVRKPKGYLHIEHAVKNNLKGVNVDIPLGILVCLTGVSGSGKSSLVEVIHEQHPEGTVVIGQETIGNNKRGCIGTYVGVFDDIRRFFAESCGVSVSLFSYNSRGACKECGGLGIIEMDMNFLGDVRLTCDVCGDKRYNAEALQHTIKGKTIADILAMTALEAQDFFESKGIKDRLQILIDVGLGYIEIGQSLDTLSGGERQRLKLASRLQNKGEFYILDEPTAGLHFKDIDNLLNLLNRLVDNGNTVMVIEHNPDVIRNADWIIDLGPEGGDRGGEIVAQGTPKDIVTCEQSYTGKYLTGSIES